jgi:hypothetical protein
MQANAGERHFLYGTQKPIRHADNLSAGAS